MMNKTAIKNFAIWARNKLIADICYRAGLMGITEKGHCRPSAPEHAGCPVLRYWCNEAVSGGRRGHQAEAAAG